VLTDSTVAESFFLPSSPTDAISVCLEFFRGPRSPEPGSSAVCARFPATRLPSAMPARFL